ncbi:MULTISPECIES: DNRLRE domain-containing protein [unclassified Paenibacillus]|uniref:CBM96 family carbohydrate-binding protein n=1 Tax=unclassified Paenibacillus TaxID=185978 RepID=UPI0015A2D925|nr:MULTISPECIES: DNRLRE domain-containing protein [unclassified Paenibacillus]
MMRKKWMTAVHVLAAALLLPLPLGYGNAYANAATPVQLRPTDDAFVRAGSYASQNYGSSTQLSVKTNELDLTRHAYLKFDLSSYTGDIGSAKLYVYGHLVGATTEGMQAFGVDDDSWSEAAINWNTKPPALHTLTEIQVGPAWKWHEIDVTSFVRAQAAGDGIASIALIQPGANGTSLDFNSKESAANKPYLALSPVRSNPSSPAWPAGAGVTFSDIDEASVRLQWPAAVHPDGVAKYRIYQNGTVLDEVYGGGDRSYLATSLEAGKPYTFKVEAATGAGEWSSDGPYQTVQIPGTEIQQTKLGNIFLSTEPVAFVISTPRSSVTWSVYDYWGNQVGQGAGSVTGGQTTITLTPPGYGYYRLDVQAELAGRAPKTLAATFAVMEPFDLSAVGDESPFGVVTHLHRSYQGWGTHLIEPIKRLGTKYIRDGLEWHGVEKEKGVYTFSPSYDNLMNSVKNAHINMLLVTGFNNPFYDNNATPYTDEGREGFANYVKAFIEQYPHIIKWVEVYNEFNIGFGDRGDGPADSRPDYYYPLLKKTYETIKATDPSITVMGPTPSEVNLKWLEDLFKLGGLNYMEKFSIHPYKFPESPEVTNQQMYALHDLIRQYNNGQTKPVWTTEASWPTHVGPRGVSEEMQAQYLVRLIALSLANGVEKFWWYDLMDKGMDETYHEDRFGLIRNMNDPLGAYAPKPGYAAYGAMTRMLNGYTYADTDTVSGSVYSIRFSNGQQDRRVLWSSTQQPITLHATQPLVITDIMGNSLIYTPDQGRVYLTSSESPVYVSGAVSSIESGSRYSITASQGFSGEPVPVTLRHDNTGNTASVTTTFEIKGQAYPLTAAAGEIAQTHVLLPPVHDPGTSLIESSLQINGQMSGKLSTPLKTLHPLELKVQHNWTGGADSLGVTVNNVSSQSVSVQQLAWTVGTQSQTLNLQMALAGGGTYTTTIPLSSPQAPSELPVTVSVKAQQLPDVIYSGKSVLISGNSIYAIPELSPVIDGDLSDWAALAPVRLPQDGTVKISSYGGESDLSGDVKVAWDAQNLYVSARMTDNSFDQNETVANAWKGDSLQFGISSGVPGESLKGYEFMISLPPSGAKAYRALDPQDSVPGLITNYQLAIVRNEAQKATTYEFALPWSHMPGISPDQGLYGFSLLVNDADGGGRKGWIEWGAGIGSTKNPALYKPVRFAAPSN